MKQWIKLLIWFIVPVMAFSCTDDEVVEQSIQLETQSFSDIGRNTAVGSAYITRSDKTGLKAGFCWSTEPGSTVNDQKAETTHSASSGAFSIQLYGLDASTTYYARAYVYDGDRVIYGNEKTFTTQDPLSTGWCVIDKIVKQTPTSIELIMEIADKGGHVVTEYGVCYNTQGQPSVDDDKKIAPDAGGMRMTALLSGLEQDTEFYIAPYFITGEGEVVYGEVVKIKTMSFLRTVSAFPGYRAAYLLGEVLMDAGTPTTEKGVCWGTSPEPSIDTDKYKKEEPGAGAYHVIAGGLEKGTTYYMRAYAKNADGVFYGEDIVFTTRTGEAFPNGNLSDFVLVEGGTFQMGEPNTATIASAVESSVYGLEPVHTVTLTKDFYISKFQITNEQMCTFLNVYQSTKRRDLDQALYNSSGRTFSFNVSGTAPNLVYTPVSGAARKPASNITWGCAYNYCKWLSAELGVDIRLPSEAEWEYAARGGRYSQGYFYSGSDDKTKVAVEAGTGVGPSVVGSLAANELGLYDMSGNTFDYCQDYYIKELYKGRVGETTVDPLPVGGANSPKVIRGGSFRHPGYYRTSARGKCGNEADCGNYSGMRIVLNRLPSSL